MRIGAIHFCGLNYFDDAPRYKKPSKKSPPKKADHKHIYDEKVLLKYFNREATFTPEHGFVGETDWCAGSRCTICGRLKVGFPDGTVPRVVGFVTIPWGDTFRRRRVLKPEYANLPEVCVNNIFDLKEEKKDG